MTTTGLFEVFDLQVKMLRTMKNFDVTAEDVAEQVERFREKIKTKQISVNNMFAYKFTPLLKKLQDLSSTQVCWFFKR